jgi:hypothetical protein
MGEVGRVVECSQCHAVLAEGVGAPVPDGPCPECGSSNHHVRLEVAESATMTSRAVAHKQPEGGGSVGEGVRISGPGDRTASGDVSSPVAASYAIGGQSPRREEGSLETASLLVAKLAEQGDIWGHPVEVDDADVDCRSTRDGESLDIQVTRAMDPTVWQQLHRAGEVVAETEVDELADGVLAAIQKKARRLPLAQRAALVLAIDAHDTPILAISEVVGSFRRRHMETTEQLGFRSVWVVGPTAELVHQLDA